MSDVRTYDISAMEQFVADLDKRIEYLAEMHEAAAKTATTIRADFHGATGKAFETDHADWQRTAEGHLNEMRAVRERVANAARNYREAERANHAMLREL